MIYVHVPFCRSFCTYCDFYSEICSRTEAQQVQNRFDAYEAALLDEIRRRPPQTGGGPRTLYFGGGTPSVLPLETVGRIVGALGEAGYEEFTFEVNPDDIVERGAGYVRGLLALGVNRISMGVQSFDDGILKWMNRRHDAAGARRAFAILREAGVANVSIDLIFGLPQLEDSVWEATVDSALELGAEHVSAYQLSVEEGSALGRMVREGRWSEASDELCRRQYDILCRRLAGAGYRHYEISNWARPGKEAVHNSAYWRRVPYIGYGPGAHSFIVSEGKESRLWNSSELAEFGADGILTGWSSSGEALSCSESAEESIMLALRTADGMPLERLRSLCAALQTEPGAVDALLSAGSLQTFSRGGVTMVRIPEERFFVSDDIISALI